MGTNGISLIAQLIHENATLGVMLHSNVPVGPRETGIRGGRAKLMLLAGQQQQKQEILDLLKGKGQPDTTSVQMYVCMHANQQTCLPQGEVILALYGRWQSVLAGGGCATQRWGALVQ